MKTLWVLCFISFAVGAVVGMAVADIQASRYEAGLMREIITLQTTITEVDAEREAAVRDVMGLLQEAQNGNLRLKDPDRWRIYGYEVPEAPAPE